MKTDFTFDISQIGEESVELHFKPSAKMRISEQILLANWLFLERAESLSWLIEWVPAYEKITLFIEPMQDKHKAIQIIKEILHNAPKTKIEDGQIHKIPICIDEIHAPDLALVSQLLDLSPKAIIQLLSHRTYRLAMFGFVPGFAYFSGLDSKLFLKRRDKLRDQVPKGALLIAAGQIALCPQPMPTGWYHVGTSHLSLFNLNQSPPTPFALGSKVQFVL